MSKVIQSFKMAMSAILSNKMRSLLTMLGIIIGVVSVTVLVSIGQSAMGSVTDQVSAMGSNLIVAQVKTQKTVYLNLEELMALQGVGGVRAISPVLSANLTCKAGTETYDASVQGVAQDYDIIRDYSVQSGRFLNASDLSKRHAVCVIGTDVARELFGHLNVVGDTMRVDGRQYEIVGLLEDLGSSMMGSQNNLVMVPFTTAQRQFRDTSIRSFYASAQTAEDVDRAMDTIDALLYNKTGDEDDYSVSSMTQVLDAMGTVTNTLTLMLAGIAGISLLVGGIGIMNIMLVSVSERTREIGIRKAIGAQRSDIMSQFMIESISISLVGGVLGLGVGWLLNLLISRLMGMTVSMSGTVAVLALGFSVLIGVIFGSYPASKASKLLPIQALRYE